RAATHLDFTQFSPTPGSRYGAIVSLYYTLGWFDRYLRGRPDALGRLTATRFDASADVHSISGGRFDPQTGQNVPARIAGQPVATTAPRHGNRRIHPGTRVKALHRAYPRARAVGRALLRANPRSPRLLGVRRGRVRFVAVASSRTIAARRTLRAYLRSAGVR